MAGMKQLMTAIEEMAETLANSDTALAHLTCREVGSIVDVLVLSGLEQHVGGVLMGHAYGDSGTGDTHHDLYQSDERGNEDELVDGYIEAAKQRLGVR